MRTLFLVLACVGEILLVSGCGRRHSSAATRRILYAPLTTQELSSIVVPGMSKTLLIQRCGVPRETWFTNGYEIDEFWISTDRMAAPTNWVMSQFAVLISNGVVCSWRPTGYTKVSR